MQQRYTNRVILTACALFSVTAPWQARACTSCDTNIGEQVRAAIFGSAFMLNTLWTALPFAAFMGFAFWLHSRAGAGRLQALDASVAQTVAAGLLLGAGLCGFFDGIVFHQILQVHSMFSAQLFPNDLVSIDVNMFWDGLFHVFCYAFVTAGLVLLWRGRNAKAATSTLVGGLLMGAGFFNAIEGLLDHNILDLHHVVERAAPTAKALYDWAFVASGLALCAAGYVVLRAKDVPLQAAARQA